MCSRTRNKEVWYSCEILNHLKKNNNLITSFERVMLHLQVSQSDVIVLNRWKKHPRLSTQPPPVQVRPKSITFGWGMKSLLWHRQLQQRKLWEECAQSPDRPPLQMWCNPIRTWKTVCTKEKTLLHEGTSESRHWHQRHSWTSTTGSKVQ